MMTPYEEKQLSAVNEMLSADIQIGFIETDHPNSRAIERFCDRLAHVVPKIRVKKEQGDTGHTPAIRIHSGLQYQAVPAGTEVMPFVTALRLLDSGSAHIDTAIKLQVARIELPSDLVIYISPQCKFCPQVVSQILPALTLNRNIRLTVIDAVHFPELAQKDNIRSVPTLILENQFRWTGTIHITEIFEMMENRDPSALGPVSMEMMLKEGNAGQLAEMMLEKDEIFPAFFELLTHPKWPVRLGAMVVMDELIEKNLCLAVQTLEELWERFSRVDDRVKGDLLYIFGEMAQTDMVPRLEAIRNGEYDDEVIEAALEALDKLKSA